MGALHDRSHHDTGPPFSREICAIVAITDGEVRRSAQHSRKRLGVAAGGAHLHVEPVLFENAGVHADIEVDVAEVVHRFTENAPSSMLQRVRHPNRSSDVAPIPPAMSC